MFQSWRIKLREADNAFKAGRLDEARSLIADGQLAEFLPGKRLAERLAARLAERACEDARSGEWDGAFRNLAAAFGVTGETASVTNARQLLATQAQAELEQRLRQGDVGGTLSRLEMFERHKLTGAAAQTLREVARRMESARNLSRRGRFSEAEQQIAAALTLRPDLELLRQQQSELQGKAEQVRLLSDRLHRALSNAEWDESAAVADELLAMAPEYRLAHEARKRAWAAVGTRLTDSRPASETQTWSPGSSRRAETESSETRTGPRLLLWVDGVGGYLVCLADEVILGQATHGNAVDVPLLADISRRHARIHRECGTYVLEPFHATRLDGRSIQGKAPLSDGDEIELGTGVRLRFRQPHALSGSARLEFISRHRTQPYADAVLLMAESCVLGPKWQNHVVCRDWSSDVVLYRQDEDLFCRAKEAIEIDGQLCDGRGRLDGNSHVVGGDFSLSLEELDRCSSQPLR
jgi:hypothetical protein